MATLHTAQSLSGQAGPDALDEALALARKQLAEKGDAVRVRRMRDVGSVLVVAVFVTVCMRILGRDGMHDLG